MRQTRNFRCILGSLRSHVQLAWEPFLAIFGQLGQKIRCLAMWHSGLAVLGGWGWAIEPHLEVFRSHQGYTRQCLGTTPGPLCSQGKYLSLELSPG